MKKYFILMVLLGIVIIYSSNSWETFVIAQEDPDIIPGRFIVLLEESIDPDTAVRAYNLGPTKTFEYALKGMAITASPELISQLESDPMVLAIEPDRIVYAFTQELPTGINRVDADLNSISKIDGIDERVDVDIAILDTGIDEDHPDLNVVEFVNFAGGINDDRNGHGTHVSGIAAALDNDIGVVGVAPGAKLWAVKVLGDQGQGALSGIIQGIDYVTQHADEIEVANLSLGGEFASPILDLAISNSIAEGVVYVVAAGNDGRDAATFSPANHPDVLSVSAIADSDGIGGSLGSPTSFGNDDTFALFSNFGQVVDIAGPGVDIESTFRDSGYSTLSGTSMAAPHVAGVAALYVTQNGRDVNGDTVVNEDDVEIIRDDLIGIGISQSDPEGFSGDRDSFPEPLVHAKDFQQVPDFSLSANPSSVELEINDSERSTVTVTGRNGFTGTISLSTTTSDDISAVLSPDQVIIDPTNPSAISILTIDSGNTAGDFSITVTGTNSTLSRSTILSVTITNGGGGCLIATAAYGSELSPQVQFLREIRDNTVMSTASGSTFMTGFNQLYYSFSPTIADMERENPMFQELVRAFITPMISTLSIMTLAEDGSEVQVLGLGISVIVLNLAMYVGMPALIGFKVHKIIKSRSS